MFENINDEEVKEKAEEIFEKVVEERKDDELSSSEFKYLLADELLDDVSKEDVLTFCILSNFIDEIYEYKERNDRKNSMMY